MRNIFLILFSLTLISCGGGSGGDSTSPPVVVPPPVSPPPVLPPPEVIPPTPSTWQEMILSRVNAIRKTGTNCGSTYYNAAPPLKWNSKLEEAANNHSVDMATHNFFSHTGSNGSNFADRLSHVRFEGWPVGENIAAGIASEEMAFNLWLNSFGHCYNMMNANANALGVAYEFEKNSDYGYYWTMLLGTTY